MTAINPTLAAAIAATGVPLSADYAPQSATPRWQQARTELAATFRDYMPETARARAVDKLDEVITEALLEGTSEVRRLKAELVRPAELKRRNEVRGSYVALISQAEQDGDHEGAATLSLQLRACESMWQRTDEGAGR